MIDFEQTDRYLRDRDMPHSGIFDTFVRASDFDALLAEYKLTLRALENREWDDKQISEAREELETKDEVK